MLAKPMLSDILENDALTRGLADPEARLLVEWLVDQAEIFAQEADSNDVVQQAVHKLCRRARAVGRFVALWCHENQRGAACQLASTERFPWPLPTSSVDPYELMQAILHFESNPNGT